jgi:hypothetical protein
MTRSFSHYTDGIRFYLSRKLEIFYEDQKIAAFGSSKGKSRLFLSAK